MNNWKDRPVPPARTVRELGPPLDNDRAHEVGTTGVEEALRGLNPDVPVTAPQPRQPVREHCTGPAQCIWLKQVGLKTAIAMSADAMTYKEYMAWVKEFLGCINETVKLTEISTDAASSDRISEHALAEAIGAWTEKALKEFKDSRNNQVDNTT